MFSHPRLQTKLKESRRREENEIASLISIMYYMPLSTVVIHVPHVLDFLRRYQRLWRELTELGLTDENGGQRHHSIRVLPPMAAAVAVVEVAAAVVGAMTGWSALHLTLMDAGHLPSVWLAKGEVAYLKPVRGTLRARTTITDEQRHRILTGYEQNGRVKTSIDITIKEGDDDAVSMSALYAAMRQDPE